MSSVYSLRLQEPYDTTRFLGDFPPTTPLAVLVESAPWRHGVEQYQEEAKAERGWDQSQGRR
jgi:hypothetical protein